jgi:hypothetical protein
MSTDSLTAERLREALHYDPATGLFVWTQPRRHSRRKPGDPAGTPRNTDGYLVIRIDGILYRAHRLAVLYMTGEWPPEHVDHRNGEPADNRWENLRVATTMQNLGNSRLSRVNRSGLKGVTWHKAAKKWAAYGSTGGGKTVYLGLHKTPEEAHEAYLKHARANYGEFYRPK